MPKVITPLNEMKVRNAKVKPKEYQIFDGGGLYLLVTPSGGKLWRLKYRFNDKESRLSFGAYPEVTLADARQRREDARRLLANGVDPAAVKKAQKQAQTEETETFEVIAREWHEKFTPSWTPGHALKLLRALERDVFPWAGALPIKELKAPELLSILRRIESRGVLETAKRVRGLVGQVMRYAVATGRAERNPSADLIGAIPTPPEKHYAALTEPKDVADLLRAIDGYKGGLIVKSALRIVPMLMVRPGELRHAEWSEINLNEAVWNIPAEKMKMKQAHIVPLSKQAVEILNEIYPVTGNGKFVFPSIRSTARPMSENTINATLRAIGYEGERMTGHGFRAMARTILDEVLNVRPDLIEAQLAHAVSDPLGRAYNRTHHLPERTKMMQTWADYLDGLKAGAVVIPFRAAKG
ncbi:MAG: tyrosine-type recombinase/integrase [Syntrophales bacterium]